MKEALGEKVHAVRFTDKLKSHPVCLSTEGGLSMEMEQTLNAMPGREGRFKAEVVLELNPEHPVTAKLKEYAVTDKEKLADYTKLLYAEGRLIRRRAARGQSRQSCACADHRTDGAVTAASPKKYRKYKRRRSRTGLRPVSPTHRVGERPPKGGRGCAVRLARGGGQETLHTDVSAIPFLFTAGCAILGTEN